MTDFSKPVNAIHVQVPPEHAGWRLDSYLPWRFHWRSRAYFRGLLISGRVSLNGHDVKKAHRIRGGDVIAVQLPESYRTPFDYGRIPLRILFEDDSMIAVDKPGHLAVQPTGRYIHENLLYRLRYHYREERALAHCDPCIVHRLDRETSGVIVFAKSRGEARRISKQFAQRSTQKVYFALVHGHPPPEGTIDHPLRSTSERHVVVDPAGRPALTRYRTLSHHGPYALVYLELLTGRQHQLRVHLATIGHPILCDLFYGQPQDRGHYGLPDRHMLHATYLRLQLRNGSPHLLHSPLPADMQQLMALQP